MKRYKSTITVFTVLLFVLPIAAYAAAADIQHPRLVVYGQVSKPVYPGRSIFEYKDDQGLSSTLDFERQNKNITINFANIAFSKEFENKSIALASETKDSQISLTKDVIPQNGLENIYLKIVNSSALSTETGYSARLTLDTEERAITNNDYLFVTAKLSKTGTNIAEYGIQIMFKVVDSGATTRLVGIYLVSNSGTDNCVYIQNWYSTGYSAVRYASYNVGSDFTTIQIKIDDLLSGASQSWSISKITGVIYRIYFVTDTALDSSSGCTVYIRHAVISPAKIYIDDPAYENGLIVNGTSGDFTSQAGDIIQIYGANATKIVGVTIPWQVEVTPEIDKDPDNLRMQYTWEWIMPKSPSSVGDTLTFSNTNMTLYGYKDGDAWDKLYLNGVDKLSSIASKKVPSDADYWTYALASSLTGGNMYQAIARIQYTADEYDALTEAPLFWSNPFAWIQYKFWSLVIAVAAFLGLSTTWAVKQRRKTQIPKVK